MLVKYFICHMFLSINRRDARCAIYIGYGLLKKGEQQGNGLSPCRRVGHHHDPQGGTGESRSGADSLRSHAGGGIPEHKAAWRLGELSPRRAPDG